MFSPLIIRLKKSLIHISPPLPHLFQLSLDSELMGSRSNHHHPQIISSLNPAWCLMPQSTKRAVGGRRRSFADDVDEDDYNSASTTTTISSYYSSVRPIRARTGRFICPVDDDNCPTSPRIGCMGQMIKRRGSKIPSHQLSSPSDTAKGGGIGHLFMFGRMLSGRSSMSRSSSRVVDDRSSRRSSLMSTVELISIAEMDPPLPVVRPAGRDPNSASLWNRRRRQEIGGLQLPLQLQQERDHQPCLTL